VFGGVLAASGSLQLKALLGLVCIGAILGDSLGYELGRRLGRPWLLRYGLWVGLRAPELARAEGFFTRHGGKTILLGRFVGFLRALAPFVAGASAMPYRCFLPYNVAGAVLWALGFVLLGYGLEAGWQRVEHWTTAISAILAGGWRSSLEWSGSGGGSSARPPRACARERGPVPQGCAGGETQPVPRVMGHGRGFSRSTAAVCTRDHRIPEERVKAVGSEAPTVTGI
jgi:hypothetical protein